MCRSSGAPVMRSVHRSRTRSWSRTIGCSIRKACATRTNSYATRRSMMTRSGQRKHWWSLARLVALALIVAALPACSFFGKEDVIPDDPADKLYNEGLYLMNNKRDYKQAAKRFEEVDRQHPYSEWARKALLMSAYAHDEGTNYDDSIIAAKRDVTLHPSTPDAAYP